MRTEFITKYYDGQLWSGVGSGALTGAGTGFAVGGPWGAAIGGIVGGAASLIGGISQKKQAARLAQNNPFPTQPVQQELLENQALARRQSLEGLPSQQWADMMTEIRRNQATQMRSAQDRRAGEGLIPTIATTTNDAVRKAGVANAQARLQNQSRLFGANTAVAQAKQSAFDWNQKYKYQQDRQYQMALLGAGNANLIHAADELGVVGMGIAGGLRGRGTNNSRFSPLLGRSISSGMSTIPQISF